AGPVAAASFRSRVGRVVAACVEAAVGCRIITSVGNRTHPVRNRARFFRLWAAALGAVAGFAGVGSWGGVVLRLAGALFGLAAVVGVTGWASRRLAVSTHASTEADSLDVGRR